MSEDPPIDLRTARRLRPTLAAPSRCDRMPPFSLEAEQGVLGCVLRDAPRVAECAGALTGEEFYDLRHQAIYEEMLSMWRSGVPVELVTLRQRLSDRGQLDSVGGIAYLSVLPDATPSPEMLPVFAGTVREKAVLRKMIQTCTATIAGIYESESDPAALVEQFHADAIAVRLDGHSEQPGIKELVNEAIGQIERYHAAKGAPLGLTTGLADIDKATCGLAPGDMHIIAARPSMGKTTLATGIAVHNAALGIAVGVITLEMTATALVLRELCSDARVNLRSIKDGFLMERDFPKLINAAGRMSRMPLYIEHRSSLTPDQLRSIVRGLVVRHGIKLFVLDYLQLMSGSRPQAGRVQELSECSRACKQVCLEHGIPGIVLAQMNRDIEKEKFRKPRLADLRECGAIEQDADFVGFLFRKPSEDGEDEDQEATPTSLLVAKQRNGPADITIPLTFLKSYTRFESAARVSDYDYPETSTHNDP